MFLLRREIKCRIKDSANTGPASRAPRYSTVLPPAQATSQCRHPVQDIGYPRLPLVWLKPRVTQSVFVDPVGKVAAHPENDDPVPRLGNAKILGPQDKIGRNRLKGKPTAGVSLG